ncbi:hypothetical protein MTO96_002413 [Rhipicephalus appendiculatus]
MGSGPEVARVDGRQKRRGDIELPRGLTNGSAVRARRRHGDHRDGRLHAPAVCPNTLVVAPAVKALDVEYAEFELYSHDSRELAIP